jgi:hypothetical protein
MRLAFALLTAGLALGAARGESTRKAATVELDGVEVRAGHALGFPKVGELKKGDSVIVVREEDTGFLAIVPPTGSVSWVKAIHLGKVEGLEGGKANVPVAVDGAEVVAGSDKDRPPSNRVTLHLPKGTIVEVVGPAVRFGNAPWHPITPPEGDLRWIPRSAIKAGSLTALTPPPYVRPETPAFTVSGDGSKPATPVAASLPAALTDHRLWAQASQAEKAGDYATAKGLYARIYQDLWDQKAERDAIVICYNRYTRCDTAMKGDGPPARSRSESRREAPPAASGGKWHGPGNLQELQRVNLDGQQVYSLQDERGEVLYYVTSVPGINLRNYAGKRVQVYGVVATRAELYKPHVTVERVEAAR